MLRLHGACSQQPVTWASSNERTVHYRKAQKSFSDCGTPCSLQHCDWGPFKTAKITQNPQKLETCGSKAMQRPHGHSEKTKTRISYRLI